MHVFLYDFVGDTFDDTILSVFCRVFGVKATNSPAFLAGEAVDVVIQEHILPMIEDDVTEMKSAENISTFVHKIRANVTPSQNLS